MAKRLTDEDVLGKALPLVVFSTDDTYGGSGELIAATTAAVTVLQYEIIPSVASRPMILVKDRFGCEDWYFVDMFFPTESDAALHIAEELALLKAEKERCVAMREGKAQSVLSSLLAQLQQIGFGQPITEVSSAACIAVLNENFESMREAVSA